MKILLVQTSFLGDNILSTPVIPGIKSLYPGSELVVLTTVAAAAVYQGNPEVARVLTFDKRGQDKGVRGLIRLARQIRDERFDIAYSLHRSGRTALLLYFADIPIRIGFKQASLSFLYTQRKERARDRHEVERNMALLEPEILERTVRAELFLPVVTPAPEVFEALCGQVPAPYAVLVPGSVWATKRWAASEYRITAEKLVAEGKPVVLLGAPDEQEIADQVAQGTNVLNLVGKTSLPQMFSIIQSAAVVVCNDSMSLHVASAFGVPTVAVFCATSPAFGFGPWQNASSRVVERTDLPCKPCRRHGGDVCPTGTNACMEQLPAREVLRAIAEVARW